MKLIIMLLASSGIATATAAATKGEITPSGKQDVACMVKALKGMRGVDRVTSGVSTRPVSAMPPGWPHPFVAYRYTDKAGDAHLLRFDAQSFLKNGNQHYYFMIALSGVFSGYDKGPSDLGTSDVERLWEKRCGVTASSLFI